MAEQGRKAGRQGWLATALGWLRGPQPQSPSASVSQAWQHLPQWEDGTERQGAILARARAQEPPQVAVLLVATPQTSPQYVEAERTVAARLALIQDAILAEQQRQQRGR